jgi:hypothetical protein
MTPALRKKLIVAGLIASTIAIVVVATLKSIEPKPPSVTGPLSEADVTEIRNLLLVHRAPLISRDFSPRGISGIRQRVRERFAGELVSVSSKDGEYANAVYRDRWSDALTYDYDLHRLTNGWRIVGVGVSKRVK